MTLSIFFFFSERVSNDKRTLEDRHRLQSEGQQLAIQRAINAELELLRLKREAVLRPAQMRLREVDGVL